MNSTIRKMKTVSLTDRESTILDIVALNGYCSFPDVYDALPGNQDLLLVMRGMHAMVERGLLERVAIRGEKSVYKVRTHYPRRKVIRVSKK